MFGGGAIPVVFDCSVLLLFEKKTEAADYLVAPTQLSSQCVVHRRSGILRGGIPAPEPLKLTGTDVRPVTHVILKGTAHKPLCCVRCGKKGYQKTARKLVVGKWLTH